MAIRGNQLERLEPLSPVTTPKLGSVQLSVNFTGPRGTRGKNERTDEKLGEIAGGVLGEAALFDEIVYGDVSDAAPDYHLHYQVDNRGNTTMAMISGFITGYSLFTIPGAAVDHWKVRSRFLDADENVLSERIYNDKMTMIMWLPLLPAALFPQCRIGPVIEGSFENIFRHSILDIMTDLESGDLSAVTSQNTDDASEAENLGEEESTQKNASSEVEKRVPVGEPAKKFLQDW